MSGPEPPAKSFLARWSQRKHAAKLRVDGTALPDENKDDVAADAAVPIGSADDAVMPKLDPESLPPLESITAASDVRAFLAPGVPEELTRAALRRAWVSDPTIRDFVGIAENQWDFAKPDGVPGFGALTLTPELRKMIAGLVGEADEQSGRQQQANACERSGPAECREAPTTYPQAGEDRSEPAALFDGITGPRGDGRGAPTSQSGAEPAAMQRSETNEVVTQPWNRRAHGGAVPK